VREPWLNEAILMPPEKGPLQKSKGTSHLIKRWKGASTQLIGEGGAGERLTGPYHNRNKAPAGRSVNALPTIVKSHCALIYINAAN
jgi:hypothetical protein